MGGRNNRRTGDTNQKQDKAEKLPETISESKAIEHEGDTADEMDGLDHETL